MIKSSASSFPEFDLNRAHGDPAIRDIAREYNVLVGQYRQLLQSGKSVKGVEGRLLDKSGELVDALETSGRAGIFADTISSVRCPE
jgi:hypothetical protein